MYSKLSKPYAKVAAPPRALETAPMVLLRWISQYEENEVEM